MRGGVIRDIERRIEKEENNSNKLHNLEMLKVQADLQKQLSGQK